MKARLVYPDGGTCVKDVTLLLRDGMTTAIMTPGEIGAGVRHVDFLFDCFTAFSGDSGWFLFDGTTDGTFLTRFTDRPDGTYCRGYSFVGCYGMNCGGCGRLAIVTGMRCDFAPVMTITGGRYSLYARFFLDGDMPNEAICVELHELDDGSYSAMAREYRAYMLSRGGCIPLAERMRENPVLRRAADSVAIRVRHGWKPVPPAIEEQTPENEPEMHAACTFRRTEDIVHALRGAGVTNAEICLVGWNIGGHDGRFPQIFPPDPRLGGEAGLRSLIRTARNAGYNIVAHDDATAAYRIADCWDEEYLLKNKDGTLHERPLWGGGRPRKICPRRQYERFELANQLALRALGFEGLHYVDVMTILPLLKCYDPRHKTTRADTAAWYRRTMLLARKTFGGFSSESGFDFAADSLDFILYSFFKTRWDPLPPVCDARVPFWPIVYHGIVLYNPGTFTLNYPVKTPRSRLHFFELGGRPLACFYANFASNSHWMGEEDLYADTDEHLADAAERIRMMADDFDRMQEVRYSFIREHEQIAPDVFRTTYENDASVTVDYSTGVAALRGADGRETLLV